MVEKLKEVFIPYFIGLCFIILGWYISILNVGLTRFQTNILFTRWTALGLMLIILGAYVPGIYLSIKNHDSKD